jgi:hypothetical protein
MGISAYVGVFTVLATDPINTPVTLSGMVDGQGQTFTPKAVLFFMSGKGFEEADGHSPSWTCVGMDDGGGTNHYSFETGTRWLAGVPWVGNDNSGQGSFGRAHGVFANSIRVLGKVTAFGSGSLTYQLSVNFGDADTTYGYVAVGGSDLECAVGYVDFGTSSGAKTVSGLPFRPTGGIVIPGYQSGSGSGGNLFRTNPCIGFADQALNQYTATAGVVGLVGPAVSRTYQVPNYVSAELDATVNPPIVTPNLAITGWTADGFTCNYVYQDNSKFAYMVFGSAITEVGALTQPTTDGSFTLISTVGGPAVMFAASCGAVASSGLHDGMHYSIGASTGRDQAVGWTAVENGATDSAGGGALYGAQASIVFTGTQTGSTSAATTKTGELAITGLAANVFFGQWLHCDGTQRQVAYFIMGVASPPAPSGTTFSTRRVRRFPHVSEAQMWLFWRRLQIDIQAGAALISGQGSDPQIMLRWSDDGGHTWSPEQWRSAGLRGQYGARAVWQQLGRSRDRVYELVVSDPVPWVFLQALAVVEKGVS